MISMIIPRNGEKKDVHTNHSTEFNVGDLAHHPQRTFGNTKMVLVVTPGELLLASGACTHPTRATKLPIR